MSHRALEGPWNENKPSSLTFFWWNRFFFSPCDFEMLVPDTLFHMRGGQDPGGPMMTMMMIFDPVGHLARLRINV